MENVSEIGSIAPPRLEDAGLEDCALPIQGIMEAFTRAADAVRSRASSILDGEEDGEWTDSLLDDDLHTPHGGSQCCPGSPVAGLWEESNDKVVTVGDEGLQDKVMDAHISVPHLGEEGESCVAALEGLSIPPATEYSDDEDDEEGFPVLAEAYG